MRKTLARPKFCRQVPCCPTFASLKCLGQVMRVGITLGLIDEFEALKIMQVSGYHGGCDDRELAELRKSTTLA